MITLVKISNREIIDIIKYADNKAIFVEKKPFGDFTQFKAGYFVLNFDNGEKEAITKSAYLLKKFGSAYEAISNNVTNYIQCHALTLQNRNCLVMFPNGQAGLFDNQGKLQWNDTLSYNDSIVYGLAGDKEYFWSCCKDENCVIRYSAETLNVDIRIGSNDADTFVNPEFISDDDDFVYVCCDGKKVRKIDKSNFTVSDVGEYEGINAFYKYGRFSIICTNMGAYIDKD